LEAVEPVDEQISDFPLGLLGRLVRGKLPWSICCSIASLTICRRISGFVARFVRHAA
jgi:hypothetical protein